MQPTDRPPVDHLKTHEFTSSLTINMLTMNHGNLTRNPKLDNKEVYNMAMKDRPIVKMMTQNSAHILCLNEADTFLSPLDEKSREIKTFIRFGYKGIATKQWSSRPIACFVRGGPSRVELLARRISTKSPPRTTVQGHGRNKEIVVLHIEQRDEYRGMLPKSSNKSLLEFDRRHVTRADLPFATIEFFTFIHQSATEQHGKIFRTKSCHS